MSEIQNPFARRKAIMNALSEENAIKRYLGKTFGRYKIIGVCPLSTGNGKRLYWAYCLECGTTVALKAGVIKQASYKKCGHIHYKWKHMRLRTILTKMKERCYNPTHHAFHVYGGKGISICDEWLTSPKCFEDWALDNGYEDGLTIDRIDPDKGYCPSNCRWVTKSENSRWTSSAKRIEINGIVDSMAGWSRRAGMNDSWFVGVKLKYGYNEALKRLKVKLCERGAQRWLN